MFHKPILITNRIQFVVPTSLTTNSVPNVQVVAYSTLPQTDLDDQGLVSARVPLPATGANGVVGFSLLAFRTAIGVETPDEMARIRYMWIS